MSEIRFGELVKKMIKSEIDNINIALPAKINKIDKVKMIAEITLLAKDEDDEEISPIIEVPISHMKAGSFVIRPPYKKGDIVQVLFNQRCMDNLLVSGKSEVPESKRKFDLSDAVIIGGLKLEGKSYSSSNQNDLLIENLNNSDSIILKENGGIEINANSEVKITSGNVVLGDSFASSLLKAEPLSTWLKAHTHISASPGTATGPASTSIPVFPTSGVSTTKVKGS